MGSDEIDRFFTGYKAETLSGPRDNPTLLESVKFDTAGYQYRGTTAPGSDHVWSTPEGDTVALIYCPGHPDWPERARTVDELRRAGAERLKASEGRFVEMRVRPTKARAAIQVIFKARRGSGWTYVGSLSILFRDFGFVIQAACEERGITGLREAMVMYLQTAYPDSPKIPEAEPACLPWDPDNARFDGDFPDHPLTRLRRILDRLSGSVEIEAPILNLPGFPLPECGIARPGQGLH
jgi:hypothetical protein